MVGILNWGSETIRYEVLFLASRRTLAIEVHPDNRVVIRAPKGCPEHLVAERVQKRAGWISRQLAEFEGYRPRTPERQYVNGESHLYLGRRYRLKLVPGGNPMIRLARGQLFVSLPNLADRERARVLLERWYRARAQMVFAEVVESCLARFDDLPCPRLIVRRMSSRWGSLSRSGAMTLNVKLIKAPRSCIEYVVTHELCHFKFRNHDARFFAALSQVLPDWAARKIRLESALL